MVNTKMAELINPRGANDKVELISKIQQSIKDLMEFKVYYGETQETVFNIELSLKYVWKEIEKKKFTSKSAQSAIELTFSILEGVYYDEVREYAAMLSAVFNKAFDKERGIMVAEKFDAKNAFMYVLEIYANLRAMEALYLLIKQNRDIESFFLKGDLDVFRLRAFGILVAISDYYTRHNNIGPDKRQALVEELDKYLSRYYGMIENRHEHLERDIDTITAMLEANEDITRGTYNVLSEAIDNMWEYYNLAITPANPAGLVLSKKAWNEEEQRIDAEDVDFDATIINLMETYADFKALQALYDVLCNDTYTLCFDDFQKHLDEALKNAKEALHLIAEFYITF
ncbi:hypothetical protein [Sulfolobus tengchongensis spindle-shaped virus 4]|nr:hypothetical protein [Sulfolobus tengchongensis spindle-shaped virus 4]